jgi:hypothetical protein
MIIKLEMETVNNDDFFRFHLSAFNESITTVNQVFAANSSESNITENMSCIILSYSKYGKLLLWNPAYIWCGASEEIASLFWADQQWGKYIRRDTVVNVIVMKNMSPRMMKEQTSPHIDDENCRRSRAVEFFQIIKCHVG